MRNSLRNVVLSAMAAPLVCGMFVGIATAQGKSSSSQVEKALSYKPSQRNVVYDIPSKSDKAKCKLERTLTKFKKRGFVVYDSTGRLLRLFFDMNRDNTLDSWMRTSFNYSTGLLVSGTIVALIIAYLVRFLAVALNSVESGLLSVRPDMDQAARSLGLSPFNVLKKIHFPIIRGSVLTGLLIVFVDVMKELPATLVLRPFNFNTLAVRAYELASDERLADAALPSIAIVIAGLLPVIILSKASRRTSS